MSTNKRPKRDMAKRMLTKAERAAHVKIFESAAWVKRKAAKALKGIKK